MKLMKNLTLAAIAVGLLIPSTALSKRIIKMATLAPENSPWMRVFRAAANEIKKETGGEVQIKIYGGGQRGDEKVVINKMKSGQLDGAAITSVGLALIAPEILVLQAPGLIKNYKQLDYVREHLRERFEKALLEKGFVLVGWGDVGYTYMFSNTPIKTPSDLKDAKPWVWASDPVLRTLYERAGAKPTPLTVPDVMQNLTTGTIEAFYASPIAAIALQWYNHAKYITNLRLTIGVGATVVTKKLWDSISDEDKAKFEKVNSKWHGVLIKKIRKDNNKGLKTLKDRGIQIVEPDKAAWKALFTQVQKDLVKEGIFSQALLDEVRKLASQAK